MKTITNIIKGILALLLVVSCTPEEDRNTLGENLDASELEFSITQVEGEEYKIVVENNTPETVAYWDYRLGTSNKNTDTINLRFAGEHEVTFTAFTAGGSVSAEPVTVMVPEEDPEAFTDPKWELLTGGVEGKTWILDMNSPIGWAGTEYPENPDGDYWSWFPPWSDISSWAPFEVKDWGEMTFDLNGGPNVTVTQTAFEGTDQTTSVGYFDLNLESDRIRFVGDPELLYGGDFYPDASNWRNIKIIELQANSMRLAVLRDQSRSGEGNARIVFHYKTKFPVEETGEEISEDSQEAAWSTEEQWGHWENDGYTLYNNIWGMAEGSAQVMWANTYSNWGVWANHPDTDGIKSYPNSSKEANININSLNSCTSGFDINAPSGGHYVAAYDIWCDDTNNDPGDNKDNYEIMLWMHREGGPKPISYEWSGGGDPVPVATNVSIGGHTWNVYNGHNGNEEQGTGNRVFSFVRSENTQAATVNIKNILDWIKDRSAQTPDEKWFKTDDVVLNTVQFGYEISASSGGLNFITNNYSVSYN